MTAVRVLLVEDNEAYRDSLAFLLDRRGDVEVAGAVATGEEAAAAAAGLEIDVAVIDLRLPGIGGMETADAVRERAPRATVVFLSASAGSQEREAAARVGIDLVQKDEGVEALVRAIRDARRAA